MNPEIVTYRKKQWLQDQYKQNNTINYDSEYASEESNYDIYDSYDSESSDSESSSDISETIIKSNIIKSNIIKSIIKTKINGVSKIKKRIPATVKRLVWNKYIGETIGKSKCYCCKLTDITQLSFHCGHILSEYNGGKIEIDNLRPICQNCNSSMSTQNMDEFIKLYKLHIN